MRRKDHLDRVINACEEIISAAENIKSSAGVMRVGWNQRNDAYLDLRYNGYSRLEQELIQIAKHVTETSYLLRKSEDYMDKAYSHLQDPHNRQDPAPPDWFWNDEPDSPGTNAYANPADVMRQIEEDRQYPYVWLKPPTTTGDGLH